jgi:hypothetical protein
VKEYMANIAPGLPPDVCIYRFVPQEDEVEKMVEEAGDAQAVLATHGTVPAQLENLRNIR